MSHYRNAKVVSVTPLTRNNKMTPRKQNSTTTAPHPTLARVSDKGAIASTHAGLTGPMNRKSAPAKIEGSPNYVTRTNKTRSGMPS